LGSRRRQGDHSTGFSFLKTWSAGATIPLPVLRAGTEPPQGARGGAGTGSR